MGILLFTRVMAVLIIYLMMHSAYLCGRIDALDYSSRSREWVRGADINVPFPEMRVDWLRLVPNVVMIAVAIWILIG
jgi:hypothetical protein